jgi:raffinose/stachyose/melibiose transport system permease protein
VRRYTGWTLVREVLLILLAIAWMIPFYFLVIVAVKPDVEALQSPLSFPDSLHLSNFSTAWNDASLDRSLVNSLIITGGSVLAIILPFQLGLVPTYAVMRDFGLVGSYLGIILLYTGIWMPFSVFLYTGFVLALPKEYEEASRVDGASALRTFRRVVFPLLRPVTGTVAIFTGLIIWNDFFLSLIYLNGTDKTPLPVAVYSFVGAFASRWNLIFAAVIVSLLPIMIFFLVAQRHLIRGFTGGIKT